MRTLLVPIMLAAAAPLALANQSVLASAARQSITGMGPDWSHFGHGIVHVGFDTALDVAWRGMVRFDLASVLPGSRVNSAVLRMTPAYTLYADMTTFYAHRLVTAWTPGAATSWTQPWTVPGGDFAPASASTTTPLGGQTVFEGAAITADVQGWVDAPSSNHGWIVIEPLNWGEARYGAIELVVDFDPPCPVPVGYCIGAPNSAGPGASIGSRGSTRISDADFALVATGLPPGSAGSFFFGGQQQQVPWGDGFLCVAGGLHRFGAVVHADAQGHVVLPVDFASPAAAVIAPGSTWNFQLRYRDAAAGLSGFNSSDALAATFCD